MNILRSTRDLQSAQYREMAALVRAIGKEVKRRNPIGVNLYSGPIESAARALDEISGGEIGNFTSECGPREVERTSAQKRQSRCFNTPSTPRNS